MKFSGLQAALLLVAPSGAQLAGADERQDEEMLRIARDHGCYLCHGQASRKPGGQEAGAVGPVTT